MRKHWGSIPPFSASGLSCVGQGRAKPRGQLRGECVESDQNHLTDGSERRALEGELCNGVGPASKTVRCESIGDRDLRLPLTPL